MKEKVLVASGVALVLCDIWGFFGFVRVCAEWMLVPLILTAMAVLMVGGGFIVWGLSE